MGGRLVLRGRDREQARLRDALQRSKDGHGTCVVVSGEPGLGKTALLDELTEEAEAAGFIIMRAKADELEQGRPFGIIRRCVGDGGAEMRNVDDLLTHSAVRSVGQGWIEQPELRFRVIDAIVETIDRHAAEAPVAVALDDYHWVDDSSAMAVTAVVRRLADRPVLVVLAARPTPDLDDNALLRGPDTEHILLPPLDNDDVAALVRDLVGHEPHVSVLREAARAGGNPFFVGALVKSAAIRHEFPQSAEPPDEHRDLLQRASLTQFHQLSEEAREVVRIASVIGSPFSMALLADLSGHSIGVLGRLVDEALRANVLLDEGHELAFRHDIFRESVYDSISPAIRAGLHVTVGHRLLGQGLPAPTVATHFMRGAEFGDFAAARVLRTAASELGRVAPATATELLECAVDLLPPHHPDRQLGLVELIQSYVFTGDLERSSQLADEHLSGTLSHDLELGLKNARSQVFFLRGAAQRASAEFESMVPLVEGRAREALVLADAAISAMFAIDLARARDLAERSVEAANRHGDQAGSALAHGVLSWLTSFTGDLAHGTALADRAVVAADAAPGLEGHRRIPHLFHSQVALWSDRVDLSRRSLERGRQLSSELNMGWDEPMYQALLADQRARAGEWDDALAEAEAGLARAQEVGSHFADGWLIVHQARIHLWRGDLKTTREMLDRAQSTDDSAMQAADQLWHVRGLLAAIEGDDATATMILSTLWTKLSEMGVCLRQLEIGPDVVRHAVRTGDRALVDRVVTAVDSHAGEFDTLIGQSARAWCQALAAGDPDLAYETISHLQARDSPVDLARGQGDAAVILHRTGKLDESRAMLGEALACFRQLEATELTNHHLGDLTPTVAKPEESTTTGWDSLTRSEKNIVSLVSQGLSNSEIAEQLCVSRRTVESHLYHAYPKLGMSNRVELAVFASKQV